MRKRALLEAVLFLTSRALTERQLADVTGMSLSTVRRLLTLLAQDYEERESAIEVARRGRRWLLQVRGEYQRETADMAPATLPPGVLKTAALIAYHQPVKQSHLATLVGYRAYEHVRRLRERGLIAARPEGQTLLLSTTGRFPEFFGLEVRDREDLRRLMASRVAEQAPTDLAS
ncbi:MAG: SMC-Scp complex subunit ScpB [Thermoplasmata archaeon]|nr:SMC-Scp complex subunit ScpB [Thermoplasmata archaeon]